MKLNTTEKHVSVVVCRGNLDAESMIRLKNSIARLIHQRRKTMVLDLAKARQADFSGIGIFLDRLQKLRAMNCDVRVANVHPEVSKRFEQAGVKEFIESCQSV